MVIEALDPEYRAAAAGTDQLEHALRVLSPWREPIHQWIEGYAQSEWPDPTPEYAGTGYFDLLERTRDTARVFTLASDLHRHDFLRRITFSDYDALREMEVALTGEASQAQPDIRRMVELSVCLDFARHRTGRLPLGILGFWVRTGRADRAEEIAQTMRDRREQDEAWGVIVSGLAASKLEEAKRVAGHIADHRIQAEAWCTIANHAAAANLEEAKRVASLVDNHRKSGASSSIRRAIASLIASSDEAIAQIADILELHQEADVLGNIARLIAGTDPELARALGSEVVRLATEVRLAPREKADVLATVLRTLYDIDPAQAAGLLDQAAAVVRSLTHPVPLDPDDVHMWVERFFTTPQREAESLASLVQAVALVDPAQGERLATTIPDDLSRITTLARLVNAFESTDPCHAERIASEAEQLARRLSRFSDDSATVALAGATASMNLERGLRVAGTNPAALAAVASAIAMVHPQRAQKVASEAVQRAFVDVSASPPFINVLVGASAQSDPELTLTVVASITDLKYREEALHSFLVACPNVDPDAALEVIATLPRRNPPEAKLKTSGLDDRSVRHPQAEAMASLLVAIALRNRWLAGRITNDIPDEQISRVSSALFVELSLGRGVNPNTLAKALEEANRRIFISIEDIEVAARLKMARPRVRGQRPLRGDSFTDLVLEALEAQQNSADSRIGRLWVESLIDVAATSGLSPRIRPFRAQMVGQRVMGTAAGMLDSSGVPKPHDGDNWDDGALLNLLVGFDEFSPDLVRAGALQNLSILLDRLLRGDWRSSLPLLRFIDPSVVLVATRTYLRACRLIPRRQ